MRFLSQLVYQEDMVTILASKPTMRCLWCDGLLDETDATQVAYHTCQACLYPAPTD